MGTEQLYFLVGERELDGGLMCTASHNPKAYTGAKLLRRGALALSGDVGIGELRDSSWPAIPASTLRAAATSRTTSPRASRPRSLVVHRPGRSREMKVVLDGGNGMAGPMVGPVLDRLPIHQVQTYWTPDGNFPDHEPNPLLPENRTFVIKKVLSEGAELGIAWDGDADRCFFIDDTGQFVDGDFLTALLAESILAKDPGAAILYDVRASRAVRTPSRRPAARRT